MIKRNKPIVRKVPINNSPSQLKKVAKPKVLKHCDVGNHDVPSLFRSKSKVQDSCCSGCRTKTQIVKSESPKTGSKISNSPKKDSLSELLSKAEKVFNAWIRRRDTREDGSFQCKCCSKSFPANEMDAGHFMGVRYAATRFDEMNVHGCCLSCNRLLYGNLTPYRVNLISDYGELMVVDLEERAKNNHKWDRDKIHGIIEKYKL